ncbi:lysoplasmalogenase-like protein TMEM86A [Varroa destructor]|uniref:lysoplasmalogenase n=1 Tax=Varroa destructor TaxID=109461 RepID=A0A7M7KD94_VARDE|nr:lysoplasmalogenase-like protein TMEM86A [Varroa destructor]
MERTSADLYRLPAGFILCRGIFPMALPFVLLTAGYFYGLLKMKEDLTSVHISVLKCGPIVLLALLAIVTGRPSSYKSLIVVGLLVSVVGDFYLVWHDEVNFIKGMVAFALAHLFYIIAFGFRGLAPIPFIVTFAMAAGALHTILPMLDGFLFKAVPVYIVIISLMFWRSLARLHPDYDWCHVVSALGALLFVISDFNLSLNAFYFKEPCKHGQLITMVTYYGGQLAIALSVIDRRRLVEVHMKSIAGKSRTH